MEAHGTGDWGVLGSTSDQATWTKPNYNSHKINKMITSNEQYILIYCDQLAHSVHVNNAANTYITFKF